ncbi:MAG: ABC transporter ATP-binding protein [Anaerolineae bacterium]|nr:ABC transporter ATP-binding protein/permease [Caldilineales bacterium]MDW8268863.1 ABC transporter ATP-binding protein [Anaerolineae bacterium]
MFSHLDTEAYDRQYSDRELAQGMWRYFRPYSRALLIISVLLIVIAVTSAALPVVVARGVDRIQEQPTGLVFALIVAATLASGVLSWAANWWRRRLTTRVLADVVLALRTDAVAAAMHHDLSFYDRYASGRIVSRITSDSKDFGDVVVLVTDTISQFIQALLLAGLLLAIDLHLSLYLFASIPLIFLTASSLRRLMRQVTRRGMQAMAVVNARIKESISGIAVAKNYRQERAIYADFEAANRRSYAVNLRRGLVLASVFPILNALSGVVVAVLVWAGGRSVVAGVVTAGAWYLFLSSLDRFFFPVLNLAAFSAQVQAGLAAAERIFALIAAEPAVVQHDRRLPGPLRGEIRFEHVGFRYGEQEQVLSDFNLHIRAGESVALVGHTGAGKSSIVKLIARFYEFQEGRIFIDGQDIRTFDLAAYRRCLGIVSQTPFLFSGTVADNIRYARPDVSDTEILALARQIGDGEWLETLPQGLQTEVGERGAWLSLGQRQLVALMRVLVQRPAIFILDEATASIDPFTERQIQEAVALILSRATSIVIAHRLSTVKAADRIVVLEKGRIIEEGNHAALLARGGHYALLYNTYFRHQSLAYVEQARALVGNR